jgi:hypothetical protein
MGPEGKSARASAWPRPGRLPRALAFASVAAQLCIALFQIWSMCCSTSVAPPPPAIKAALARRRQGGFEQRGYCSELIAHGTRRAPNAAQDRMVPAARNKGAHTWWALATSAIRQPPGPGIGAANRRVAARLGRSQHCMRGRCGNEWGWASCAGAACAASELPCHGKHGLPNRPAPCVCAAPAPGSALAEGGKELVDLLYHSQRVLAAWSKGPVAPGRLSFQGHGRKIFLLVRSRRWRERRAPIGKWHSMRQRTGKACMAARGAKCAA